MERYTWSRHWPAQVSLGLYEGVWHLGIFVAMRSLGAGAWVAPTLVVLGQAPWLISPALEGVLGRGHPQRGFRITALLCAVPLLFVAFVGVEPTGAAGEGTGDVASFLVIVVVSQFGIAAYLSHRGAFLRTNYAEEIRGRIFGLLQTLSRGASIVSAKLSGWLLDLDPRWLRVIYPASGLFLLFEQFQLSRIKWRRSRHAVSGVPGVGEALRTTVRILREDAAFRTYEIAFMLYGFAFLMSVPMVIVFGERDLAVSYDEWTWAYGVSMPVAMIAAAAPFGRLADHLGMVRATAFSFLGLCVFLALIPFVTTPGELVALFAVWGVAMAGVMVTWNLGPLLFAREGQARAYAATHVSLVGVRSIIAPVLGYALAELVSLRFVFMLSAVLMLVACFTAWGLARRLSADGG